MKLGKVHVLFLGLATLLGAQSASAQNWGTGMYGGMQACPYQLQIGDEATSIKEDMEEMNKDLREAKSELSRLKSRLSSLKTSVTSQKDLFKLTGFEGEAFSTIENHITGGYSCSTYQRVTCATGQANANDAIASGDQARMPAADMPGGRPPPAPSGNPRNGTPQGDPCGTGTLTNPAPFAPEVWARSCENGAVRASICEQNIPGNRPRGFNPDSCKRYLGGWIEKQRELRMAETKVAELDARVKELEAMTKAKKQELREAVKEYVREQRQAQTEGGCIDCMIMGNSGVMQQRRASGWEIGANVVLGLGAMYLGNQMNKYTTDQNARLGFPTQPYPALGYGMPFFTGALYGALGGSTGGGSFGCAGGTNGSGFPNGPYGMMGPFGQGSMYGPMGGGAFGYPANMYGSPMGGGMFMPGMGPFGMGMPGGLGGGMGMGMPMGMMMGGGFQMGGMPMGMMVGGGMPMGMMISGGIGMMGGMPMGMQMGMPMGMQMGMMGGMPMGMQMGMMGGLGMMGGMPMGMQMGMPMGAMVAGGNMMGMPMGMAMGMPMPMMASGGMMMGGMPMGMQMGMPMGMQMGGMMDGGMGMQMQMQMQQSMMQMQMQQYQQYVSMQQQAYQSQMARSQVVAGLTQEMYTLMFRIQQAQMGIGTGGYIGVGTPGMPALPGQPGGVNMMVPSMPYSTNPGVLPMTPTTPGTGTAVPSYR